MSWPRICSALRTSSGMTGMIALVFGALCIVEGKRIGFGQTSNMGPGYFPFAIGCIACLLGLLSFVDARKETKPASIPFTFPIVLVIVGFGLFALLLPTTGLFPAGAVLALLSIFAVAGRIRVVDLLYIVGILALAALIFVEGIGLRIPLYRSPF